MTSNPLSRLEAAIAASARVRDQNDQKERAENAAKAQLLEDSRSMWERRRAELPAIVNTISGLLESHGYAGVALRKFDLKHSDIDRAVIEFRHSVHSISIIILCATLAGDFTCTVGTVDDAVGATKVPMSELTEDRLKEALSQAVMECLKGKRAPRPN